MGLENRKGANTDDDLRKLAIVEKLITNGPTQPVKLRKAAEDVYEAVVLKIAAVENCDASKAYALATKDPIAQRAYALVVEMQDQERSPRDTIAKLANIIE